MQQDNETTKEHYFQCVGQCRAVRADIRVHRIVHHQQTQWGDLGGGGDFSGEGGIL